MCLRARTTYSTEVIDSDHGGSGYHETLPSQVEKVALYTVFHARGWVQLAVDGVHSPLS